MRASVETDEGLWGIVETGGLTSEPLGTRPVVIVPVHGNGHEAGKGHEAANGEDEDEAAGQCRRAGGTGRGADARPLERP